MTRTRDTRFPPPPPRPSDAMTKWQAQEWVHNKLIIVEMGYDELIAAFTVLAERPPGRADRVRGLFRRCCEIVTSSPTPWGPEGVEPLGHTR
jgi:hypothetical protein